MLCCGIAAECKDNRRSITKRLFHIVHHIRHNSKEIFRLDFSNRMFHIEKFCRFGSNSGLVKAFFIIAAGIRSLGIRHCKHIRRIHTAGQERFSSFISSLDFTEHLLDSFVNFLCPVIKRFAVIRMKFRFPVTCDFCLAVLEYQIMTRH